MTHEPDAAAFEAAWKKLGTLYPAESWFRDEHLVENRGRIRRIVRDITTLVPKDAAHPVVDVGCFNGFLCYLLHQLGYPTCGIDALADAEVPERAEVMDEIGAPFYQGNFNAVDPIHGVPKDRFSAVILGEVFEHILTHPLGLLEKIHDLLVRDGILVLTTPNPLTLANSVRILRGKPIIWGDTEFATMPKIGADHRVISYAAIHYREYPQALLVQLLERAGFTVIKREYIGSGSHPKQPRVAQLVKATPFWRWMEGTRLFGSGNYLVARRLG